MPVLPELVPTIRDGNNAPLCYSKAPGPPVSLSHLSVLAFADGFKFLGGGEENVRPLLRDSEPPGVDNHLTSSAT